MAGIKIDPAPATALRKMVEEAERIALISHTAPDGDSVGSSIGFAAMLREKGKSHISVIVPDDIPQYLYSIPGANKVIASGRAGRHRLRRRARGHGGPVLRQRRLRAPGDPH